MWSKIEYEKNYPPLWLVLIGCHQSLMTKANFLAGGYFVKRNGYLEHLEQHPNPNLTLIDMRTTHSTNFDP